MSEQGFTEAELIAIRHTLTSWLNAYEQDGEVVAKGARVEDYQTAWQKTRAMLDFARRSKD